MSSLSPFDIATNIKTVVISNLTQFESSVDGYNFGVGHIGWDNARIYARANDLDYFGSVYVATGRENTPQAFSNGMWTWNFFIRLHSKFELAEGTNKEQDAMDLSDDFMRLMFSTTARQAIVSTGNIKVTSANFTADPIVIDNVTYMSAEFLLSAKLQIGG